MNSKLAILQITNRLPYPLNDGGNLATYNVTKYLNRFGHRVILASLNTKKHHQDPGHLSDIATVHASGINTTVTPFGLIKGLFSSMPYNVARFESEAFRKVLEKIIKEEKPDIIQLEGIYLAIYLPFLKSLSTAPIVLRSHNVEYEIWERTAQNEKNFLKKIYLRNLSKKIKRFEKAQMLLFDGIIAITERDREFYLKNGVKKPLKTVPAGVDMELISDVRPTDSALSLCFLGSMEWMPNLQAIEWYLEKVWPSLSQKFPSLSLHIAGKSMTEEMKQRKIKGVFFHGMVADAGAFLDQHLVMIVPLLSGGGMRLKIVEAMAHGQCVMSTAIGAEGIDASDSNEIIIANTAKDFIAKTESLMAEKTKAITIGHQAKKLVQEKYSWEKLVREIEKFYLELI